MRPRRRYGRPTATPMMTDGRPSTTKTRVNFRATMGFSSIWNLSATPASASILSWESSNPAQTSPLWTARRRRPTHSNCGISARVATCVSRIPIFVCFTTPPTPKLLAIYYPCKAGRSTRRCLRIRIKSGSGRVPASSPGLLTKTTAWSKKAPRALNCVPVTRRRSPGDGGRW